MVATKISPPGVSSRAQRAHEGVEVRDMLDHFHREHDVEASPRRPSASAVVAR